MDQPTDAETLPPEQRRTGEGGTRNDAEAAFTERLPDGWEARWVFAEQDGTLVVRSVTIEPTERATPAGGVTAALLRTLSVERAKTTANTARGAALTATNATPEMLRLIAASNRANLDGPPRRGRKTTTGRPRLSEDFLAEVALTYLAELPAGRGVLGRVGRQVGPSRGLRERDINTQTTKDWVRIARSRGFLTEGSQGQRGAQEGPALVAYIEQLRRDIEGE